MVWLLDLPGMQRKMHKFNYSRIPLSGTSQLNSPAFSKSPLDHCDSNGDRVQKAEEWIPLRPKSRLNRIDYNQIGQH
jgi:hypothetical protein